MAAWARDEHLTFDIAFALKKVTISCFRRRWKKKIALPLRQRSWST